MVFRQKATPIITVQSLFPCFAPNLFASNLPLNTLKSFHLFKTNPLFPLRV